MDIDLNSINMFKGQQYECIITTKNKDNSNNAAPIGVICKNKDTVICKIFKTSKTLKNICNNKKFRVNISHDPFLFTLSTIDNIPLTYYNENNNLENIDAYFDCKVIDFKKSIKKDDPVRKEEAIIVIAKLCNLKIINKRINPINRGMHYLIESLVNYTRIDFVSSKKQDYYLDRLKESERIITKVGSSSEREALEILKKKIIAKGFNLK